MLKKALSAVIIGFAIFTLGASRSVAHPTVTQTTTFIDVGQGDAALLQDGDGFNVLIDGGETNAGPVVVDFLRAAGITELDVVLASHADSDHIGGLIDVLQATDITIHQVLYNGYPGATETWDTFAAEVGKRGLTLIPAQFPSEINWGMMRAYVLNPAQGLTNPETNDASLVVRVDFGQTTYLFTGDINTTVEAQVIARGTPVAAEILKVAHHGSAYSSSTGFLATVSPEDAVISVGADNRFNHPSTDTLARLGATGATIFRTDQNGNITVSSDGVQYTLTPSIEPTTIFLPVIMRDYAPPPADAKNTGLITITTIFYDGTGAKEPDEYVEIRNDDTEPITLLDWTISDSKYHTYTFPAYVMVPGKVCRIYTNLYKPEFCGFTYWSNASIWTNDGDTATLIDSQGSVIDQYSYGSGG